MSLSIVTFANLGGKKNLKTSDILPVITKCIEEKQLEQIICQRCEDFYFRDTSAAVPALVYYPLRVLEKFCKVPISHRSTWALFDFFASFRLQKADVVLFHPALFKKTLSVAKKNGSIVVGLATAAHPHVVADLFKQECKGLHVPVNAYLDLIEDQIVGNDFDYIIAFSEFVKDTYIRSRFPAERIFVAYPDIDTVRFTPQKRNRETDDRSFKVLYVAYTTVLKGLQYLLEAWSSLHLENTELILVGGYGDIPQDLKRRYDDQIARDPSIRWAGDSRTPETYYRDASVLVFPSLTEGFSRVMIEAMACGLPVITTENARGIVEDGKTGFVVPIRDAKAIKEKIEYLYHRQDVRTRMGSQARMAVERKKPFGEAVFEIYQEILGREHKI